MASGVMRLQATAVALAVLTATAAAVPSGGFIRREGKEFVDANCVEFNPAGFNAWPDPLLVECMAAMNGDPEYVEKIEQMFDYAEAANFNTFRFFAHGVDNGQFVLQPEPGVYNETVFQAIDYLIYRAGEHNIRVLISPSNNWERTDSKHTFVDWAGLDNADLFWSDETAKQLFKNHLTALANRTNHWSGVQYRDDPTIFAFNLFNEFRCPSDYRSPRGCANTIGSWVLEMSRHLKSEAPNHMVSLGAEGFFALGSGSDHVGPYGSTSAGSLLTLPNFWPSFTGQDPFSQHLEPYVDFLTAHFWPISWRTLDYSWAAAFLAAQQVVAARLNKPLVIEEFGANPENGTMIPTDKDPWYHLVHNAVLMAQELDAPLQGALFWAWNPVQADNSTVRPGWDTMNTYIGDSTWQLVTDFTEKLKAKNAGNVVAGCVPDAK